MTDSNRAFRQRFPHCLVRNTENQLGPAEVLEQFGKPWEQLCATLTPVLIHWSADATDAQSTGLYVLLHNPQHEFFEVHGSTSSWHAFEGCWSPEPVSSEEMRAILTRGWLRNDADNPLRGLREAAAAAMGLDLKALDKRAKDVERLMEQNDRPVTRRPSRRR